MQSVARDVLCTISCKGFIPLFTVIYSVFDIPGGCWGCLLSTISLGGGFKYVLYLYPYLLGEMIQFDLCFSDGLKPPTSYQ